MNDLGTLLVWSALQATLLALAAMAVYPFAARRRPAAGAAVAAAALGGASSSRSWRSARCPPGGTGGRRSRPPRSPRRRKRRGSIRPPRPNRRPPLGAARPRRRTARRGPSDSCVSPGRAWAAAAPFADRSHSGWAIAAMLFLAGAAFGLLRLAGGLWAVYDLRRRSRLALDEPILRLMQQLREEIGCRRPVELRECPGLGAPAAAGWLRPVVLLPADWRDWARTNSRRAGPRAGPRPPLRLPARPLGPAGPRPSFLSPAAVLAGRSAPAATGAGRRRPRRSSGRWARRLPAGIGPAGAAAQRSSSGGLAGQPALFPRNADEEDSDAEDQGRLFWRQGPAMGPRLVAVLLAGAVVGVSTLRCPAQKAGEAAVPPSVVTFVDGGTVEEKGSGPRRRSRSTSPTCRPTRWASSASGRQRCWAGPNEEVRRRGRQGSCGGLQGAGLPAGLRASRRGDRGRFR